MGIPDWTKWKYVPTVQVWEACALALNIDPDAVEYKQVNWNPLKLDDYKYSILQSGFPDREAINKFDNLLRFFIKARKENRHFTPTYSLLDDVRLQEFATWCASIAEWLEKIGQRIPTELAAIAEDASQPH